MKKVEINIYKYEELDDGQKEMAQVEAKMLFGSRYWIHNDIDEHLNKSYYDEKGRQFGAIEDID